MNNIHSFLYLFIPWFVHSFVYSFLQSRLAGYFIGNLSVPCRETQWVNSGFCCPSFSDTGRKSRVLPLQRVQTYFFVSIAPKSWDPIDAESSQSLYYLPGGTLGTIESKMDEVLSLDSGWFCISRLFCFLPIAFILCVLPLAWTIAEFCRGKCTNLSLVGQDSSTAGRPKGCHPLYSFYFSANISLSFRTFLGSLN